MKFQAMRLERRGCVGEKFGENSWQCVLCCSAFAAVLSTGWSLTSWFWGNEKNVGSKAHVEADMWNSGLGGWQFY